MPTAQQSQSSSARRFAGLFAGSDVGNSDEEEAVGKFRAMRRMAVLENSRIIDLLERPDVRKAIDDQMQPVRQDCSALQDALEARTALTNELTERKGVASPLVRQGSPVLHVPIHRSLPRRMHRDGSTPRAR